MRQFVLMIEGATMRNEQRREEMAWAIHWLMAPHCGGETPSIDTILGRAQPAQAVELGDGLTATGDPNLIRALQAEWFSDDTD